MFDTTTTTTYTTTSDPAAVAGLMAFLAAYFLVILVIWVIEIVALWKVFTKAGKPGWAAIVPIYNIYLMIVTAGKPGWWILLLFIPFVNIVIYLLVALGLAERFGKSSLFGVVGLFFFQPIGLLMLGFGDAKYKKA